ncbi:uncharacterized protein LOC129958719 [Argiope bruennichi]|uniref:uncharacterized protein LOC129958719 n=1 Tax=Argiope bruennichi TaxID=94029 RepID=UPI0024942E15|nr:uncharacterized protein LOC129958719 [Argiope bruennichi]
MDQMVDFYLEEEEKVIPKDYSPNAESFFKSKRGRKKRHEKRDSEGFKLPFLPSISQSVVSCTYSSTEIAPPGQSREMETTMQVDEEFESTSFLPHVPNNDDSFDPTIPESDNAPETSFESMETSFEATASVTENCLETNESIVTETSFETSESMVTETSFEHSVPSFASIPETSFGESVSFVSNNEPSYSVGQNGPYSTTNFEHSSFVEPPPGIGQINNVPGVYYMYEPYAQPQPLQTQQLECSNYECRDYFGLDDRDLNIPMENASIEMPTQLPNDAQLIDAIKDWLKSPNFDFLQNLEPNPPDLPLDLYEDLFD